ncbi:MAG: methyltransferase domain-containing protein [Hyphomicrobiaceae bacterium]
MAKRNAGPRDFYLLRYAAEAEALQNRIFAEADPGYFGQGSWTSTADYDRLFDWLGVGPGSLVLDIASGAGAPALRLAERRGCRVVGIDRSRDAVDTASKRACAQKLADRVHFEVADASARLPFDAAHFDAVISVDGLIHLPDRPNVLGEWARVLKSGGRLAFTDQIVTGPIMNTELSLRTPAFDFLITHPGYNERLLEDAGFALERREDLTETIAGLARRHWQARESHRDALIALEGLERYEVLTAYRRMAETLARERRLSHVAFLARRR